MSNNFDIGNFTNITDRDFKMEKMEIDEDDTRKIRHVFVISCHGIESNQSENRYYYSVEDVIFKNLGWISTGVNLSAYADEVNEKLFNSDEENGFDLFRTINTEVCLRDQQDFSNGYITNINLPPMLFEFRDSDKFNNDRMMSERMGLYFATVEESNYTDNEGKEKVRYTTTNLEHIVHFNNLNASSIPNVNIINESPENHIETYFELGQQQPWQKIFGMANTFLLKKMENGIINEEDLNNNVYFRIFCCRATLRVDSETNQVDRSMKTPLLLNYNKYYKPVESENTLYLYNEILNTAIYDKEVALRLYNICFYRNPFNDEKFPINYDEELLRIYYMLMVNINPYIAIPYINDNIPDYERQTIISFPSDRTNSVVYKLTAMLTREIDNKYWSIPLIKLPLDNNSYELCKLISDVLLQDTRVRRSYFIAYKNNPLDNENERGIILSIYGYLTSNQLGQAIGIIEIIQYNLDRNIINSEFNEEEINNMLRNNTHKINFTYNVPGIDLEVEKCNLILNSINKLNQDYGFTYIHLLFKDISIYIGGMNNNRLNQYNPNVTDKNNNENMQVVSKIEPNDYDMQLLTGQMDTGNKQIPFQSIPAGDVRKYTKKDVEPVFKLTLQQPSESEPMDVEYDPNYDGVIAATSPYYQNIDSQRTDPEFSTQGTPRTPDRLPREPRFYTPNQGITRSTPSSNVSGTTTLPDSQPGSLTVSPNTSYPKRGPGSPGRGPRLLHRVPSYSMLSRSSSGHNTDSDMEEDESGKLPPGSTGGKKQKVKSKKSSRKKNYVPIITSKKIKLTKKCYHKEKDCCCDVDKSKCSIHKCKPKNSKKQTKKKNKKK